MPEASPNGPIITELQHTTLKVRVSERIRQAILSGTFRPGERLNETHLAARFSVSRIPVREALLELQEQGLIIHQPHRGMFVVQLTDEDVQRINSLRIILEAEAIKLCRANLTASHEAKLSALVERLDNSQLKSDFEASMLDLEFHRAIWADSQNPFLQKTLNSLLTVLFSHQALAYLKSPGKRHWPLKHHRALLDVIRGTSNVSPEKAMVDHLSYRYTNPQRFSSLALSNQ